jgi:hypothetical protein
MTQRLNPNSARYWFDHINSARIPVPKTKFIRMAKGPLWKMMDGSEADEPSLRNMVDRILELQNRWNGAPLFIRSDLASAKHDGPAAYQIPRNATKETVVRAIMNTFEDNLMKDQDPEWFMIREWLDLVHSFRAFAGHPIAQEWRYFATPDKVVCKHFYWPEEAISFWDRKRSPEPADWRKLLSNLASQPPPDILSDYAMTAAKVCNASPMWSVDFAHDIHGDWYLIDMAVAAESFHGWDGCPIPNNHKPQPPVVQSPSVEVK